MIWERQQRRADRLGDTRRGEMKREIVEEGVVTHLV
jgi:hypothetical protein